MSSSSSPSLSVDQYHFSAAAAAAASSSDQLCYVHCYICDTVLAVSVPPSSLFNTVTVRCGHCTNLLPVNMGGLLLPNHFQLALTSPPPHNNGLNRLEEMPNPSPDLTMNQPAVSAGGGAGFSTAPATIGLVDRHLPRPPFLNRTPEKRQRIPSAYNRFIKEEIQRIKAENPDISHREAFSAAAKNWAHFPHIHFGLMPDQSCSTVKSKAAAAAADVNGRQQQESNYGDQGRTNNSTTVMIEGFNLASAAYS